MHIKMKTNATNNHELSYFFYLKETTDKLLILAVIKHKNSDQLSLEKLITW